MSILSSRDILQEVQEGRILIDPFKEEMVGPCSVDLHLSSIFTIFRAGKILSQNNIAQLIAATQEIDTGKEDFTLSAGQFVLAQTEEKIAIPTNIAATLEGKSSNARLGIIVHAAGLVNPGTGLKKPTRLTLEIYGMQNNTVALQPGMPIIQIIFHRLTSPAIVGYDDRPGSKYVGLDSPRV